MTKYHGINRGCMLAHSLYDTPINLTSSQDISEYYSVGHDHIETLTEPLVKPDSGSRDISFLFAGSGDGRNLFSAITSMAINGPHFGMVHFTVLDLKPASMARLLIFFSMMAQADDEISKEGPAAMDYFLAMAYLFSCQIIPPFVEVQLQSHIQELITKT